MLLIGIGAESAFATDRFLQSIQDTLGDIQKSIDGWQRHGSWELSISILIGIVGLVVTALQVVASRWIKAVTAGLGILSGVLVLLRQNYFEADHRAYYSLSDQAHQLVSQFKRQLAPYGEPLQQKDYIFLSDQLTELQQKINNLRDAAFGKNPAPLVHASALDLSLISSAYAEDIADVPDWAKTVPTDQGNIYFVGVANDRTAAAARDTSQQQAQGSVESSFEAALRSYPQIPAEDAAQLSHKISASAEVVSTFVVPASGAYRGYVLLRVPRSLAILTAKSFFLAHGLGLEPKAADEIYDSAKTASLRRISPR